MFSGPPFWLRDATLDYYWNLVDMPAVTRAATDTSGQGVNGRTAVEILIVAQPHITTGFAIPDLRLHTPTSFIPPNISRNGISSLKG